MPEGDYNPNSPDSVFTRVLTKVESLETTTASILSIVQTMQPQQQQQGNMLAQLEQHCPTLGGDGSCQGYAEKGDISNPLKWVLALAVAVATAIGSYFSVKGLK